MYILFCKIFSAFQLTTWTQHLYAKTIVFVINTAFDDCFKINVFYHSVPMMFFFHAHEKIYFLQNVHLYFTTIQRNCFCSVIDLNVVHRMVFQRNVNKVRMDILLKFDVFEVCHNAEIQMIDLFRQVFTSKYLPIYQFIYFLHKAIFLHVICIFSY